MQNDEKRTQNETEINDSGEIFKRIFLASPDGLIISRTGDGKILQVNRSAERILEFTESELLDRTVMDLLLSADTGYGENAISGLKENGFLRDYSITFTSRSGENKTISLETVLIDTGTEKCYLTRIRDTTEKQRTADMLKASEERYRRILDSMLEGIAILGFDWTYHYVNDANARHAHMKKEDMLGKTIFDVIPGVEKSVFFEAYQRCLLERIPQRVEACFAFEDGSKAWYEALANPVNEGIFVMSMDITERKLIEEELKKKEHILELILGHINEGIIVSDAPDGNVLAISKWGLNHTIGRSADAIIDLPVEKYLEQWDVRDINTGDKIQHEQLPVSRALKGETIQGEEWLMLRPDGSSFITSVNAVPIYNFEHTKVLYTVATWTDITERKMSEKAVSNAKEQYEMLFNSIEEGFAHYKAVYDEHGRLDDLLVLDINPTGAKLSGVSRENQIGRQWKKVWSNIEDSLFDIYREVDETGEFFSFEHFSGITRRWYANNIYKIASGEFAVTFFDITDRKVAENNLNKTLLELERSNKDLERFAFAASHDLQEPIRMMGSYAHLLLKRYKGNFGPQADRYLKFLFEGALRLQLLIRDLLNYSRLRADKMSFSKVDLNAVLISALDDIKKAAAETNAVINYGELPEIIADRNQIKQLFANLLSNAIKFRKKDVIPKINISAEDRGKEWLFSVEDNGIGIEPEFAKLIFDVFQRLNNREEYPGVGIGLAICKRIVERHDGSIGVESENGKGARFFFSIPKKEDGLSL